MSVLGGHRDGLRDFVLELQEERDDTEARLLLTAATATAGADASDDDSDTLCATPGWGSACGSDASLEDDSDTLCAMRGCEFPRGVALPPLVASAAAKGD